MKTIVSITLMAFLSSASVFAQTSISKVEGWCGEGVRWTFDGYTLFLKNTTVGTKDEKNLSMADYDTKTQAPWIKKKLNVQQVEVGAGITRVGSCAFMGCRSLKNLIFKSPVLKEIGWGAFMDCSRLANVSLPSKLSKIETLAFARCSAFTYVEIPAQCRVEEQAFVSCQNLQSLFIAPTAIIGSYVFATEVNLNGVTRHSLFDGEIKNLPAYITVANCREYGLSKASVDKCFSNTKHEVDYDIATSEVDTNIPDGTVYRENTYALIIGNQNYRFVSNVSYAIHDAHVFAEYCKHTLGIPASHVWVCEDATKQMILEDELVRVQNLKNREDKRLIVYYAGHGVPDVKDKNKAYLLPTDVRGTHPSRGISLDSLYNLLGSLNFERTSVFLDACFSGADRNDEALNDGLRAAVVMAEEGKLQEGNLVVFSAAKGNETAQGYPEQGHGLFTYYLLKSLQESVGNISLGNLSNALKTNVTRQAALLKLRKDQTPTTNASESISSSWEKMGF